MNFHDLLYKYTPLPTDIIRIIIELIGYKKPNMIFEIKSLIKILLNIPKDTSIGVYINFEDKNLNFENLPYIIQSDKYS
jgi:hypothetical protein